MDSTASNLAQRGQWTCDELWWEHDIVAQWTSHRGELLFLIGSLCLGHVYDEGERRVWDCTKVTLKSLQRRELGGRLQLRPACRIPPHSRPPSTPAPPG
jgi:hypothetical protein